MCAVELCGLIHCSFIHQQRSPWEEGIINESNLQWRLVVDQWAKSLSLLIYTRYTPLVIVPFSSLGPASHFSRTACFSQNGDPVACPLALHLRHQFTIQIDGVELVPAPSFGYIHTHSRHGSHCPFAGSFDSKIGRSIGTGFFITICPSWKYYSFFLFFSRRFLISIWNSPPNM